MGPKEATKVDQIVGYRIASMRRAKGLSQADLGTAVGVTFQQIQKYEKGVNRVGASRLQQIACHLDVSISVLFEDDAHSNRRSADLVLLGTPGANILLRSFAEIANDELRRNIISLVESTARIIKKERK
jgi:transcriptional regulator with XRE-family HTH domain